MKDKLKQIGIMFPTSNGYYSVLVTFDEGGTPHVMFASDADIKHAKEHGEDYWVDADSPHLGGGDNRFIRVSSSADEELFNEDGLLINI
tara:strand:- start:231 stop:497 length:267 start_codon:yes stop_codon:yes gene_type:complete